ncbi:hypothetical protein ACEZCY_14570 [Streptacidiphilus sp. N1-12]|uniref:Uncharacterized protein n=2 Tax=Streptacidiphilus alkalitolerans TaxID=3342712 RepID=A0ABV6WEJ2_9ACTN
MSRDPSYVLGRLFGRIPRPTSARERLIEEMTAAEGGFIWTREEATELVDAALVDAILAATLNAGLTCDAGAAIGLLNPIGPCILRAGHDGPVHVAANGAKWWPTIPAQN